MSASSVAAPTIIPLRQQRFALTEGKGRKSSIKTDTPIELSSDTANSAIYYTVNGDKPDPFSVPSSSRRRRNGSTIRYTKPFTLSTGKHTIRAVAIKDNGVTSSVITREFVVEQAPSREDVSTHTHLEEEEGEEESSEEEDCSIDGNSPEGQGEDHNGYTQHPLCGTQQLTPGLWSRGKSLTGGDRICLRCSHQFRDSPGIHYCPRCSYPIPPAPTPLLEPCPPQSCPQCHAVMLKNLPSCPSCHTPMEGLAKLTRIIAQYNQNIKGGVICDYCGTINPRDSHLCVTCERTVTPLQHCPQAQPVYPLMFCGAEEACVMCSACGRVNARDARFCDWCGVQPKETIMDVVCRVCSTANNWQARFCTSCKLPMDPSIRPSHVDRSSRWKVTDQPDGCVWYPVVEAEDEEVALEMEEPVATAEQGTQTHGFFQSARSMTILQSAAKQQQLGTGQHPASAHVAAYSPGRGFWRQQVDHVAHHLRTHTANCEEFQQTFGQLQMGKLSSAAVSVMESDEQATVTLTFQLKDKAKGSANNGVKKPALLSLTNKETNSLRMGSIAQLAVTANKARKAFSKPTQLSAESYLLIKELSVDGKGRADIVRQLIEEGGSVNTTSEQGDPLICLAASSGRCEALKVLIDCGVDLTQRSRNGETALHAAVSRGNGNHSCVELLLKSGCNPKVVNRAGLTAGQAAQEKGYSQLSALLTAHVGSAMLRSLLK